VLGCLIYILITTCYSSTAAGDFTYKASRLFKLGNGPKQEIRTPGSGCYKSQCFKARPEW
jgi:hypothetical protein